MLYRSVVAIALLSLVLLNTWSDAAEHVPYHGPPAPLNHDGTVAFTAEIKHANAAHTAAFVHEFKKLQAAASLAAAHPDRTSPPSADNTQFYQQQYDNGQYTRQEYSNGHYNSQQEDDGQYKPHLYENSETYNPQAHIPAPLNHDGSVAQTPEFNAIAASLHAVYNQALTRGRRSVYRYHGPPAPLNHDGTVADTDEVKHATAILKAAIDKQHHLLQHAGTHDHYESDNDDYYNLQHSNEEQYHSHNEDDGQYKPHLYVHGDDNVQQEDDGQYKHQDHTSYNEEKHYKYNPETHIPAPLNHDGTVAHTAAYKAIEGKHHAQYEKELHRHSRSVYHYHGPPAPLNHDGTVADTDEVKHATAILKAAIDMHHQLLQHAETHDHYVSHNDDYFNYQHINQDQYHSHHEDDGQYKPHLYEKEKDNVQQEDDGQYKHYDHKSYNEEKHYKYNPEAHIPAPLNHDGTVAHTAAYKAIAAKHHARHEKELHRHSRSAYHYHGPPAPLNHDGTVADTEDVKHATAILKAAIDKHHQLLQQAGNHADYETHNDEYYNHQHINQEQYHSHHEDDGQYKPHLYEKGEDNVQQEDVGQYKYHDHTSYNEEKHYKYNPAPLNHDGTVAHTSAYKAIAAKHHSHYEKQGF